MSARLDDALAAAPMTGARAALHRELVHGRRAEHPPPFPLTDPAGRLNGPARSWLIQPAVGAALERLGAALTYDLTLPPRCRETVILTVAHHHDSAFERYAHRLGAARAGLSAEETEELCAGRPPATASPDERCAHRVARELLAEGRLAEATYRDAVHALGHQALFEVTTLTGFYTLLAHQLSVYAITPPTAG